MFTGQTNQTIVSKQLQYINKQDCLFTILIFPSKLS